MKRVELYAQVPQAVYVEGMSQREAARSLWDRSADRGQDAGILSPARVSAEPAGDAAQA